MIQEFGTEGSTVGAHLTLVHRDLAADRSARRAAGPQRDHDRRRHAPALRQSHLRSGAATSASRTSTASRRRSSASSGRAATICSGSISRRFGSIRRAEPSAARRSQGSFNKIGGRHWLWGGNLMIESPEFDPLDFGRLNYAGDFTAGRASPTARRVRAGSSAPTRFRSTSTPTGISIRDLGVRNTLGSNNSFTLKNFWVASFNVSRYFRGLDAQLTRGGPAMGTPLGWNVTASLRNSSGAQTRWSGSGNDRANEFGETAWTINGSVSARPSPSLQFSFGPSTCNENGTSGIFSGPIGRQYLTTLSGGRAETYGRRYIFGLVDRTTLSAQFRVQLHLQAGRDARCLRRAVRGQRTRTRVRRAGRVAQPRPADVRHRRHHARAARRRQLPGDRRRRRRSR